MGALALVLVGATVLLARPQPAAAGPSVPAQDDATDGTTTTTQPSRDDSILIKPGDGRTPEDAGDRGGALQISLFLAVVVGVAGVAGLGLREARRNRAHQATS